MNKEQLLSKKEQLLSKKEQIEKIAKIVLIAGIFLYPSLRFFWLTWVILGFICLTMKIYIAIRIKLVLPAI